MQQEINSLKQFQQAGVSAAQASTNVAHAFKQLSEALRPIAERQERNLKRNAELIIQGLKTPPQAK